jgi:hypothetical protein
MAIKKDTLDELLAGRDPKALFSSRASTTLALRVMTHSQKRPLAGHLRAQRAAAAMCNPGHSSNLPEEKFALAPI